MPQTEDFIHVIIEEGPMKPIMLRAFCKNHPDTELDHISSHPVVPPVHVYWCPKCNQEVLKTTQIYPRIKWVNLPEDKT